MIKKNFLKNKLISTPKIAGSNSFTIIHT